MSNQHRSLGFIEQFNYQTVSGWSFRADPDPYVRLVFNSIHEFKVQLSIGRTDLSQEYAGFSFSLPDHISSLYPLAVECFTSEGVALSNSPRPIETREEERCKVLKGLDGWLFLVNDSNQNLEYISNKIQLPDALMKKWARVIHDRHVAMRDIGCRFVQCVIPEKCVVYDDKLPASYRISDTRPVTQIQQHLTELECSPIVYGPLRNQETELKNEIYYKGDTHFNYYGAYGLVKEILETLYLKPDSSSDIPVLPPISEYQFATSYQASDLLTKLASVNVEASHYPRSLYKHQPIIVTNEARAGRVHSYHNPEGKGRLFVLHTSSIDWMMPFLNDTFRDVLYLWGGNLEPKWIDWFQPDSVIAQTNERFLTACPSL